MNQKGFAQILILLLLITGITVGAYLVGQRTNLLPKAAGNTTACDGQTLASQSTQSQNDFRAAYGQDAETQWVIEHEQELSDKGTPCGSGKAEGGNCTLSNKDSISSTCANEIDDKNPGFVASIEGSDKNTCTRAQIISHWCSDNPSECNAKKQSATSCGGSGGGGAGGSSPSCPVPAEPKKSVDETYKQAKVANNLARYCGIMNGITEYCTPADLGVNPQKNADAKDGGTGRLLLCSGKDRTLVWNVIIGNSIKVSSKLMYVDKVKDEINLKEALSTVGLEESKFKCGL